VIEQVLDGGGQPALHQQGGHDAVDEGAKLADRGFQPAAQVGGRRLGADGANPAGRQLAGLQRQHDELALQPVMQISGDPAALGISGGGDPGPGGPQRGG